MIKYMLDTNIVIYVIKRRPIEILHKFNANVGRMVISSITLAELMHGAEKSKFVEKNTRTVEDFISRLEVVHYDDKAAFHYGSIRSDLEKKGTPIGVNDLHIAGHARSSGLVLVTNNEDEFKRVNGLIVENWIFA
ncbi:type II toxin-antitoxin system tRNA(fMet)-specific endonuclease VapC [Pseudomonas orientalis]|uniref:Ribonuclease VapC n=1 Tax=Pseudomonas orientalis TaxID=76758 RepID=A0A1H2FAP5_9PSED|nr:type II toxin-antitoxin system VapC family toxin [Pseudomonas orientalis]KRP64800.1 plasmid maintenance protein [Pseudomonas orientalis]SDU04404.1 tRNA(fMet)-specific endonuclease VapC [Pseudomonas orientalis]